MMAQCDPAADVLEACRRDLDELTPETVSCQEVRAVVQYLASLWKRAMGVGRATVTVEQLDVCRWPTREPMAAARRVPPLGWCDYPLLLHFYEDPDVWTLSLDEGDASGADDAGAFVCDDKSLPPAFIRAHQEARILHGGRDGLYEVSRMHHPDAPPEAWRWEMLARLGHEEVRERIVADLRRGQDFDGLDRQVVERTERGAISDRMVRDPELERLAGAVRELCEHDLARLASLEAPFHRAQHQNEIPGPPPGP
jgi:hypothetical protein